MIRKLTIATALAAALAFPSAAFAGHYWDRHHYWDGRQDGWGHHGGWGHGGGHHGGWGGGHDGGDHD